MFNSPFGSFHDTVAEAKEEREQLDRLLTISTPGERRLVVAIALLLVVLTAWLFFSNVARSLSADAVLMEPGRSHLEADRSVQALVRIERSVAPHIKPGLPVELELSVGDGAVSLDGEVVRISAVPVSEDLAAFESAALASVYRVVIELDESLDPASVNDRDCRIVIELGRQSLVALFRMRRS